MKARVVSFLSLAVFCANVFCADPVTVTVEPYTKDEFPDWARHVRRTEIITFGSLPFVTLATTLGYGIFRYIDHDMNSSYFPNPLAKTSSDANLSRDEQLTILAISAGISLALGLVDLTVNLIKERKAKKEREIAGGAITITEMSENDGSDIQKNSFDPNADGASMGKFEFFFYSAPLRVPKPAD
jgi:hypothetical protein